MNSAGTVGAMRGGVHLGDQLRPRRDAECVLRLGDCATRKSRTPVPPERGTRSGRVVPTWPSLRSLRTAFSAATDFSNSVERVAMASSVSSPAIRRRAAASSALSIELSPGFCPVSMGSWLRQL